MTDAADSQKTSDDSPRRSGRVETIGALLLLLAYVEGPVLVGWFLNKVGLWDSVAGKLFFIVFAPLESLYQRFEFVKRFYDWQNDL